jgi:predicted nucleic acid-binding protein
MVLVDTTIWIRFTANHEPYAEELQRLLSLDEVMGHQFVYGELLIGDRGGRTELLADYQRMDHARVVPDREVVAFVRDRRLHGLGTADPRLPAVAEPFGIVCQPPATPGNGTRT